MSALNKVKHDADHFYAYADEVNSEGDTIVKAVQNDEKKLGPSSPVVRYAVRFKSEIKDPFVKASNALAEFYRDGRKSIMEAEELGETAATVKKSQKVWNDIFALTRKEAQASKLLGEIHEKVKSPLVGSKGRFLQELNRAKQGSISSEETDDLNSMINLCKKIAKYCEEVPKAARDMVDALSEAQKYVQTKGGDASATEAARKASEDVTKQSKRWIH